MKTWVRPWCLVLFSAPLCLAQAGGVAGEWRGVWTNPQGLVFSVELTLETGSGCKTCAATGSGSVWGTIEWKLQSAGKHATPDLVAKVGMTGVERVAGEMKGEGLLVLGGYDAEDPSGLKGVDQYRLAISDDGKVLGGISLNGGSWTGQFIAMRVQH